LGKIVIPIPFKNGDLLERDGEVYIVIKTDNISSEDNSKVSSISGPLEIAAFDHSFPIRLGYIRNYYRAYTSSNEKVEITLCSFNRGAKSSDFGIYDFSFFKGKLEKENRFLKYLSEYIKNEKKDSARLCSMFIKYVINTTDKMTYSNMSCFTNLDIREE
jgi:hypothetical protein